MRKLTEHFTEAELRVDFADHRVKDNAAWLCREVLEPVRAKFGAVTVTSGYRRAERNKAAGGKKTSFHLYEADKCAADIECPKVSVTELFRWLRMESKLPFDKVIMETNKDGVPQIIHIQAYSKTPPRRLAYIGETGAGTKYVPVEVA